MSTTWVNGAPATRISSHDRGLLYGDGLFETLLVDAGRPRLWNYHLQRLRHGCERLQLEMPDTEMLLAEIAQSSADQKQCVVRLTLTRGCGGRGYRPPSEPICTRIVQVFPTAETDPKFLQSGLTLDFSPIRLAAQGTLAGIKCLGRLEQVLARAALMESNSPDALMLDSHGRLIESTQANVFLLRDGQWFTPVLSDQGIEGVYRAFLLDQMAVKIENIFSGSLKRFQSMFLCNSVRGIMPVAEVHGIVNYDLEPSVAIHKAMQAKVR